MRQTDLCSLSRPIETFRNALLQGCTSLMRIDARGSFTEGIVDVLLDLLFDEMVEQ